MKIVTTNGPELRVPLGRRAVEVQWPPATVFVRPGYNRVLRAQTNGSKPTNPFVWIVSWAGFAARCRFSEATSFC